MSYSERRLSWTAVGYPLANGSSNVIFDQTLWFSQSFSNFQQQMFLANNMIQLPFPARLKLALRCYFKYMRSPLFSPFNSSYVLPTILMSVLQYPSLTGRVFLWWGLGVEIKISQLYTKLAIM